MAKNKSIIRSSKEVLDKTQNMVNFCLKTRKSPFILVYYFIMCIAALLLYLSILIFFNMVGIFSLIFMAVLFIILIFFALLSWKNEIYEFTSIDVIHQWGLISIKKRVLSLRQVEIIRTKKGLIGRIFDYGTITLKAPVLAKSMTLNFVPHPHRYLKIIERTAHHNSGEELIFNPNKDR